MKLNDKFLLHKDGETSYVLSTGETDFSGILRGDNETASFIFDCLRSETSEDEIVANMCREWDVSEETVRRDIRRIVDLLRGIGAIDE